MGSKGTEIVTDFAFFGSYEYICGLSDTTVAEGDEPIYSRGGKDFFVLKVRKSSMARSWGKYSGRLEDDISLSCTTDNEGNIYGTAYSSTSTDYSESALVWGLYENGDQNFMTSVDQEDTWLFNIVFNEEAENRLFVFGYSGNSLLASQGDDDFVFF